MVGEAFGWDDDVTAEGEDFPDVTRLTSKPGVILVGDDGPLVEIERFHPASFTG
jgi:hypothetical protein